MHLDNNEKAANIMLLIAYLEVFQGYSLLIWYFHGCKSLQALISLSLFSLKTRTDLANNLSTYAANFSAQISCPRKQGKLSGSRLSTNYDFGSHSFQNSQVRWIFPHFLDKIK